MVKDNDPDVQGVTELENKLGIQFTNRKLLQRALTHRSYSELESINYSNERLEFLGDSILSAAVASYLYLEFPEYDEGLLSRLKSVIVSRKNFFSWAKELDLGKYVFLSQSEMLTGGRHRESILANTFEALIGAVYLEKGYNEVQRIVFAKLRENHQFSDTDYKSRLQELIQQKNKVIPEYYIIREEGPDHDKTFTIIVKVKDVIYGEGQGKSKKEAEQAAAKDAFSKTSIEFNEPK